MRQKILVVLTSIPKYPHLNRATGLGLGEAMHFVKKVEAAGYAVDYVSPAGGYTQWRNETENRVKRGLLRKGVRYRRWAPNLPA